MIDMSVDYQSVLSIFNLFLNFIQNNLDI